VDVGDQLLSKSHGCSALRATKSLGGRDLSW